MWVEWDGLDDLGPDVDFGDDLIDVKFRDGQINYDMDVMWLWWDHTGASDDIVAWRYSK